jgi:hypothetical protein
MTTSPLVLARYFEEHNYKKITKIKNKKRLLI